MALSCLTWNNGKPCVWFDLKLNCCADPVDYVSSEGGLQVCRYHQYAVEGKTSEQGETPATDRQQLKAAISLVRQQALSHLDTDAQKSKCCDFLLIIEQQAAV